MEKLCKIRDLQRAVNMVEAHIEKKFGISLNEGMALCSISKSEKLSSGEIGEMLGLTPSNTSKVIKSIEEKGLIIREIGAKDKRQMYFIITEKGQELIGGMECCELELPVLLNDFLQKK